VTATPSTAQHLAEIDARHDAHLSALREHAEQLQAAAAAGAAELAEHLEPNP
jgi:hypothetical protein